MMKPIYAKNNEGFRICYRANDTWRLQERDGSKGSKTNDPWHDMSPPLSLAEARKVLSRYDREKTT